MINHHPRQSHRLRFSHRRAIILDPRQKLQMPSSLSIYRAASAEVMDRSLHHFAVDVPHKIWSLTARTYCSHLPKSGVLQAVVLLPEGTMVCLEIVVATLAGTTKTSMGGVSLSSSGNSGQILANPCALMGCDLLSAIWNNTSTGLSVVADLAMATEFSERRLQCRGLK